MNATPENAALLASFMIGEDEANIALALGQYEEQRQTWRYRLFTSRWRKEADRLLAKRLLAKMVRD